VGLSTVRQLAIFGGAPAFSKELHVGRPNIGDRERMLERLMDILDRRWLTNRGPYVQEFEKRVAELLGVRHCIAMCNGTVALEIATRALGLEGEVIMPSMTFVATAHALQWQQITPVFCDIAPNTHHIDPAKVEAMITPRTSGIIGVHLWGRVCDVDALCEIAQRHSLKIVFDAAHAFGCSHKGRMAGGFGDAEVLSFHATKFVNSFEGGAVVTDNDELAEKIRLMQNFGFAGEDTVIHVGTNGKMSEIAAAMGLTSMESMDRFVAQNFNNYQIYQQRLSSLPGVRLLEYHERDHNNYQYIVLEIDEAKVGISRDLLLSILRAERVRARRYFYPGCHRMEPYRSYFPHAGLLLPETEKVLENILTLPTGTDMGPSEVAKICALIELVIRNAADVRQRLNNCCASTTEARQQLVAGN